MIPYINKKINSYQSFWRSGQDGILYTLDSRLWLGLECRQKDQEQYGFKGVICYCSKFSELSRDLRRSRMISLPFRWYLIEDLIKHVSHALLWMLIDLPVVTLTFTPIPVQELIFLKYKHQVRKNIYKVKADFDFWLMNSFFPLASEKQVWSNDAASIIEKSNNLHNFLVSSA